MYGIQGFISLRLIIILVLVAVSLEAGAVHKQETGEQWKHPRLDAELFVTSLSMEFLREPPEPGSQPRLYVGRYDLNEGLLAGFTSASGKRILLWSAFRPDGAVVARAFHLNPATDEIEQFMTVAPSAPHDFQSPLAVWVGGVNITHLLEIKQHHRGIGGEDEQRLKAFMRTRAGLALLQSVPAMYAILEEFGNSAEFGLLSPFGVIRMAMELTTGQFAGFDYADKTIGTERAREMRSRCLNGRCQYRGRTFVIQESGLFDMMSDDTRERIIPDVCPVSLSASPISRTTLDYHIVHAQFSNDSSDNNCFGMCGPGCLSPIPFVQIYTPECEGHDNCVAQSGHVACALSTPAGCNSPCNNLIEAVWSFIKAIFGGSSGSTDMWPSGPYYTPQHTGQPYCTFEIYCMDGQNNDPYDSISP